MKKWTIFHWYIGVNGVQEIPLVFDERDARFYLGGDGKYVDYLLFETKTEAEAALKDLKEIEKGSPWAKRGQGGFRVKRFSIIPL